MDYFALLVRIQIQDQATLRRNQMCPGHCDVIHCIVKKLCVCAAKRYESLFLSWPPQTGSTTRVIHDRTASSAVITTMREIREAGQGVCGVFFCWEKKEHGSSCVS